MPSKTSNPKPASFQLEFEAIGTQWRISSDSPITSATARALKMRIAQFDNDYSRFKPDSWLRRVSAVADTYDMPPDAQPLFDLYQQLYVLTDGAMTPLIGQVLSDAGYDENYSLRPGKLTVPPTWQEAINYAFPELTVKRPILLDVGAAGKGYLIDIIGDLLQSDYSEIVVNAGGDIKHLNHSNQREQIGLEHPEQLDEIIGVATIGNQSLCGSAGNRRQWDNYNHIIDPMSLQSPTNIKAIWTVAKTALLADGLTTALYFVQPALLLRNFNFEYAIMYDDNSLQHSQKFPAEFFTSD